MCWAHNLFVKRELLFVKGLREDLFNIELVLLNVVSMEAKKQMSVQWNGDLLKGSFVKIIDFILYRGSVYKL